MMSIAAPGILLVAFLAASNPVTHFGVLAGLSSAYVFGG